MTSQSYKVVVGDQDMPRSLLTTATSGSLSFAVDSNLKFENHQMPALQGVICSSLWWGILEEIFSNGCPDSSKVSLTSSTADLRTLSPSFPIFHILDFKSRLCASYKLLHLQNLLGILLKIKIYGVKPHKISSETTLNILYSYCSHLWVLFLPKRTSNKVKLSQHIYFCVQNQPELSSFMVNEQIFRAQIHKILQGC